MRVLKVFLKVEPLLTVLVIIFKTLSKLIHIVAFLLPLKVILLVGSEKVPHYFSFFIKTEQKMAWVAGLALASVFCYLLSLILDEVNSRLGILSARRVVNAANKMTIFAKQEEKAQLYYAKITGIFSLFLFVFVALLILYFANSRVLFYFVILNLIFFISTAIILGKGKQQASSSYMPGNRLAVWVINNKKDYIAILSSIIFLICFLIILYPYFYDAGPNILFSLIAFVIIRQTSNRYKQLVNKILAAYKNRFDINTLMFKGFQQVDNKSPLDWQTLFSKEARNKTIAENLGLDEIEERSLKSYWVDTCIPSVKLFQGSFQRNQEFHFFQLQVYSAWEKHLYEREVFLFNHIDREVMKAPLKLADFQIESYSCQILDAGIGETLTQDQWQKDGEKAKYYYWAIKPTPSLVKAYKSSRPLLHQQLQETQLDQIVIAIETQEDINLFNGVKEKFSEIQERVSKLPLYVHNKQLHRENVMWASIDHSDILHMVWQRWSLLPIGANLVVEDLDEREKIEKLLEWLHNVRKDTQKKKIQFEDIALACCYANISWSIEKQEYGAALSVLKRIHKII